jgi:hypothetical protein
VLADLGVNLEPERAVDYLDRCVLRIVGELSGLDLRHSARGFARMMPIRLSAGGQRCG